MNLWCEWSNLEVPKSITLLTPKNSSLTGSVLEEIEFYVPQYMGGGAALEVIPQMKNLRVLQLPTAGFEDALKYWRPGVTICNAGKVHSTSTSELAVGLAIAAQRGFPEFIRNQQKGIWGHQRFPSLADSKVAIIGYGDVGKQIAERLKSFEVDITAYSRSGKDGAKIITELDADLPLFDIVILIAPLTDETKGMFGSQRLSLMKSDALLINVARGQLVDTDALLRELRSGRLRAALDVTDPEPLPPDHPLWKESNCIITPHVGGDTSAFEPRMHSLLKAQLERHLSGEPLRYVVKS